MPFFHFISSWFKKQESSLGKVFERIDGLLHKAEPIVADLSKVITAETKVLGTPGVLKAVEPFLHKYITVEGIVEAFLDANKNTPVSNLLHNAAREALSFVATGNVRGPAATILSDLDLAVQTAYSALKG